jgi:hypothetical protein
MSLKPLLEVAIHIQNFRNIDLFLQGLYYLKVAVSQGPHLATPYQVIECETEEGEHPASKSPGRLMPQEKAINSRNFYIRFNEEEVCIDNLFLFHLEMDSEFQESAISIRFQLYFLDVLVYSDIPSEDYNAEDELLAYNPVSEATIQVSSAAQGVNEYCPVVFDDQHFCVANLVVHTGIVEYSFPGPELNTPRVLSDFLFPGAEIVEEREINGTYAKYIQLLAHNHERLRTLLQQIMSRCVDPESGPELEDLPSPLLLPEYRSSLYTPPYEGYTPTFSEAVCSYHPDTISFALLSEAKFAAGKMFSLFRCLLDLIKRKPGRILQYFIDQHKDLIKMRASDSFVKTVLTVPELPAIMARDLAKEYKQSAKERRCQLQNYLFISEECFYDSKIRQPMFFEETYLPADQESVSELHYIRRNPGVHLMVIVHGFQGNSFDVRLIKNNISVLYPNSLLLCSEANQDDTEDDIFKMGERLAKEVSDFISEHCPRYVLGRLSFISHSLGGLIVRAALLHLSEFRDVMHLYLSLSTPHLGYTRSSSRLINTGMWFITRLNPATSLLQLTLQDERELRHSMLYQLSSYTGLGWFKQVVLVSSHQDQYSPADSSRIEVSPETRKDPRGPTFIQMAQNILAQIHIKALKRIDVDFTLEQGVDSWIGRKAHIEFLENQTVIRTLICKYPDLFS